MVRVLVIVAALAHVSSADPIYPQAITDRPLVLPPGVTALSISHSSLGALAASLAIRPTQSDGTYVVTEAFTDEVSLGFAHRWGTR